MSTWGTSSSDTSISVCLSSMTFTTISVSSLRLSFTCFTGLVSITPARKDKLILTRTRFHDLLPISTATLTAPASKARMMIQQHSLQQLLVLWSLVLVTYSFSPLKYRFYRYGEQAVGQPEALLVFIDWHEILCVLLLRQASLSLVTSFFYDGRSLVGNLWICLG